MEISDQATEITGWNVAQLDAADGRRPPPVEGVAVPVQRLGADAASGSTGVRDNQSSAHVWNVTRCGCGWWE